MYKVTGLSVIPVEVEFRQPGLSHKAQPHDAMLHTHDGTFPNRCDVSELHAMLCDTFSNMLVIWLPILEYLSYLLSDSQTACSILKSI